MPCVIAFSRPVWIMVFALCLSACMTKADSIPPAFVKTSYKIYSYHLSAPFYSDDAFNISSAWVDQFNQWSKYIALELVFIDRSELNDLVASGEPYAILWANRLWFKGFDPEAQESSVLFLGYRFIAKFGLKTRSISLP